MANPEHVKVLKQGAERWRTWRESVKPEVDLSGASLRDADLSGFDLSESDLNGCGMEFCNLAGANLFHANLAGANLFHANLKGAKLNDVRGYKADFWEADLSGADLSGASLGRASFLCANLSGAEMRNAGAWNADFTGASLVSACLIHANLIGATLVNYEAVSPNYDVDRACDLSDADLSSACLDEATLTGATLRRANLTGASLHKARCINTDFGGANLTGCNLSLTMLVGADFSDATITGARIYGVSAWNVKLEKTTQHDLVISRYDEPVVTVDDLEVGQFIYLMLNNTKIRSVIDTVTSKGVLILGRFADPARKAVLDGLRHRLREFNLLPMVFDFDRPTDKDYTETVQTLAGMSMFVIVDVTLPKSTPLELEATVKHFKVPYVPIIDVSVDPRPFAMLVDSQKSFHWVLSTLAYESKEELLDPGNLKTYIIDRAMAKREELRRAKNEEPEVVHMKKKTLR